MSLKVTYIGHATTLIEWENFRVLTDPVFSKRVLCFKRITPLKFKPSALPPLNAVLLSHAHYDHLDLFSFKYIPSDALVFVPEGMAKAVAPFINNTVIELSTWSRYSLGPKTEICAVPAKHLGGRLFCSLRYRCCHGYVISHEGQNVYFAGDTSYDSHFEDIRAAFPIHVGLLPAARTHHSWWQKKRHLSVKDLVQAWIDLGKPDFIPIHWGTFFKLFNDPRRIVEALQAEKKWNPEFKNKMHLIQSGDVMNFS